VVQKPAVAAIALGLWAGAVVGVPHAASPSPQSAAGTSVRPRPSTDAGRYAAVVDQYCVRCHNERTRSGGLVLSNVDFTDVPAYAERLEKVVRKLGTGAMPPQGMPRPDERTHDAFVSWLASELDRAAAAHPDPGRALLRRLNRTEYANAIRDLLDLEINVTSLLPVDNSSYGFDNIADTLGVSPVLMERYLTAARRISAVAVGDAAEIPVTDETYRTRPDLSQDTHIEGLPLGTRGGLVVRHTFPLDAEYVFRVRPMLTTVTNVRGLEYPHDLVVLLDGREVARASLGGREEIEKSFENATEVVERIYERFTFRLAVEAGPHDVGAAFVQRTAALPFATLQPYLRTTWDLVDYTGVPHVESVVLSGPYSVTGPGDTPSRRRIFTCRPSTSLEAADEAACATRILSALARRAYRRPVTPDDMATLMRFYDMGRKKGRFDTGIELALRRILASPDFVFRIERDPAAIAPGAVSRVSDVELASRLSFFLWSSIPDDELLQVAGDGKLQDPAVLDGQIRRMLADGRSRALIDNFAGQWLYLRNLRNFQPDPSEFPNFDHTLRQAMLREMELFFGSVIDEDRSVMDLLTAGDTFVNERLARHYGIPNTYGSHFRRVTLTEDARRGLLGKGAILVVTSLATRTSPVVRGKWILENIVGMPPPAPPPDVPALEENTPGRRPRSMRERLEAHRRNPTCAACHRLMDPIGFAMEPFDGVGAWRTTDSGSPIDGSGVLTNGVKVDGPSSLREALASDPRVFVTTMTEKLFTYALGRGLTAHDMPAVRAVVRAAARDDYRFSSLMTGIVTSTPFQMRIKVSGESEEPPAAVVARAE
jgi:mono/diheme cytochrome c family protein